MARGSAPSADPRVASLSDSDTGARDKQIARLVADTADPIISRIVRAKLITRLDHTDGRDRSQDALELQNEIRLRVLGGLQRGHDGTVPIVDFPA